MWMIFFDTWIENAWTQKQFYPSDPSPSILPWSHVLDIWIGISILRVTEYILQQSSSLSVLDAMVMLESTTEDANQRTRPSSPLTPGVDYIGKESISRSSTHRKRISEDDFQEYSPSEEELDSLRRVADKIPWRIYTLGFVELCERFSYYGATVVCKWWSI